MKTVDLIELSFPLSLKETYQKLSRLPGFILLESSDTSRGRYDILSAYPHERVIIQADTPNKGAILNELKQKLVLSPLDYGLPFQGGAMGTISYDLGAYLHGIKSLAQPTLHDMPLLDLGIYDWAIIVDHHAQRAQLLCVNRFEETQEIATEMRRIWQSAFVADKAYSVNTEFNPLISKEAYRNSFLAIQEALLAGRSYQVNLTQPFHAEYEGSAWQIYKKISTKNPVPFSAFINTDDASILSFSPERFLLCEANHLLTSPIKGTIHRSYDLKEDDALKEQLSQSEKNRAENIMIVDLLRNDLGKIATPGSVKVGSLCQVQSFQSVHHLVSDITAEKKANIHPLDAFLSCFPGGSITGAPKLESMKIIHEQEPYARGVYCGCIGYFSWHGRFDTNIAIRTITAKNNILHLAAGGGIVMDSQCEEEYRECYTKIQAIINGMKN